MSAGGPLTLGDVLATPTHPGRDVLLFLAPVPVLTLDTLALVVDLDEGEEELEAVESRTGFRYALGLRNVRQVVTNARLQRQRATSADLLRAFLYYLDHDAFIDFRTAPE